MAKTTSQLSESTTVSNLDLLEISKYNGTGYDSKKITFNNATYQFSDVLGTGLLTGGVLTVNETNTKFNVSAGVGLIVDNYTDPLNPTIKIVTWNNFTAVTDNYIGVSIDTQIAIDTNGDIFQQQSLFSPEQMRDYIFLGKTIHPDLATITATATVPKLKYGLSNKLDDLIGSIGVINVNGNKISANGSNLLLNRSAGTIFRAGSNYINNKKEPDIVNTSESLPVTFKYRYRNGSGGFITSLNTTSINPNNYDNGTNTLATVDNNKWTVQRVYFFTIGTTYVTYGQSMYNNLAEAVSSINQSNPIVDPQFSDASLLAWLILKQGTTNLNDTVNNKIIHAGKFGEGSVGASSGGDVLGPSSSISNSIARFDGVTGKYIKDGGETFTNISNHVTYAILNPIYNQVGGTGLSNIDLLINRTETNIGTNPLHQYLLELSVNNVKKFSVDNTGTASYNGVALSIVTKTTDYNLLISDYTVLCDTASNNVAITLLDATACSGSIFNFKRISAGGNSCTINTVLSQTIDGSTSKSITTQYSTLKIQSDGSNWFIV